MSSLMVRITSSTPPPPTRTRARAPLSASRRVRCLIRQDRKGRQPKKGPGRMRITHRCPTVPTAVEEPRYRRSAPRCWHGRCHLRESRIVDIGTRDFGARDFITHDSSAHYISTPLESTEESWLSNSSVVSVSSLRQSADYSSRLSEELSELGAAAEGEGWPNREGPTAFPGRKRFWRPAMWRAPSRAFRWCRTSTRRGRALPASTSTRQRSLAIEELESVLIESAVSGPK